MAENYYLLDDMEKYFSDFKREEYEHLSINELKIMGREYYKEHLPIDATTWIRVNEPDEKLIYKDGQCKQVCMVRDNIMYGIFYEGKYERQKYDKFQPLVIGTHFSKSVLLPVMMMNLGEYGVKIILRNNFYDWNMSVVSDKELNFDFMDTFSDEGTYCCCQGFPEKYIFGKYEENKKNFTVCVNDDYRLYTFMWLLKRYLKVNKTID